MEAACRQTPSRPGEFHPEPLTDPDVTLSCHPARATGEGCRLPPRIGAPPVASWLAPNVGDLPPSLCERYTRFITITEQSAPLRRIGTFGLAGSPLVLFPWHRRPGSQVPYESPNESHAS